MTVLDFNHLQTILDWAPVAVFVVDGSRKVTYANRGAGLLSGDPAAAGAFGQVVHCVHHLDHPDGCGFGEYCRTCLIRSAVETCRREHREIRDLEVRFPVTGSDAPAVLHLRVTAVPVALEGEDCALLYVIDETRCHETANALQDSEALILRVFERVSDGILIVDRGGVFHRANGVFYRMFALTPAELEGLRPADLHPASEFSRLAHLYAVDGDRTERCPDVTLRRRDGTLFRADMSVYPVEASDRSGFFRVYFFRDITDEKSLQATMAQSDRLASIGMLAAGVAHEINNPLTYVLYHLESIHYALEQGELPVADPGMRNDLGRRLRESLQGVQLIAEIVRGLKVYSRVEQEHVGPVNVEKALDIACQMAAHEIKYRAGLFKDYGGVPPVMAGEGRLCQVFVNLLVNAAQAIPEGAVDRNAVRVETGVEEHRAVVRIRDTGKGVSDEDLPRLFEPFFTTREPGKGTGLGLAICRNIVTGYGGSIEVSKEAEGGACFTVRLPLARTTLLPSTADDGSTTTAGTTTPRVLIVDDEEGILAVLHRMLRDEYEVHAVPSVEEARAVISVNPVFDGILCDAIMPGMMGTELYRWLQEYHPLLCGRFIFMSGDASAAAIRTFIIESSRPVLEKPFRRNVLLRVLRAVVDMTILPSSGDDP